MRCAAFHTVMPILALLSACGGAAPTAPGTTLIIVDAPATFALGASHQLRAVLAGSAQDCAGTQWTSSAPAILSIGPDGIATAQSPGEAEVSATCGGATAAVHARVSAVRAVSISASFPTPMRVGGSQQLNAGTLSGTPPRSRDCLPFFASSWESSRPDVATVAPSGTTAIVTAHAAGETTITATCDGVSGSITVKVTAGWTVAVFLNEVPPVSMTIVGTVEVLTGPHAGTRVEANTVGFARLLDMECPFRVRLSADEYQDAEFDVTSDNVTFWPHGAEIRLRMKPLPAPPGTDEFIVQLGAQESRSWRFDLRSGGTFSALVRFELEYNDYLDLELRCDDRLLASRRVGGGRSPALTATVPGPCAGEVKVRPLIDYPTVALRLRVTYPH